MMRSLSSGVSGLRVHQTRMDVIAHNVSNVNTVGFKGSRVLFNDVFSQTVSSASGASPATGRGGVNPMQIGLGANVASIDRMMTQGAAQRTDHNFDLMLEGPGFFIVGDESGQFFTRAGALRLDHANNLTISNGMKVMGWGFDEATGEVRRGPVRPIQIQPDMISTPPTATTQVNLQGNLVPELVFIDNPAYPGTEAVPQPPRIPAPVEDQPLTVIQKTVHDSLGNRHTIDLEMRPVGGTPNNGTAWQVTAVIPEDSSLHGAGMSFTGAAIAVFGPNGNLLGVGADAAAAMADGAPTAANLVFTAPATDSSVNNPAANIGSPTGTANDRAISINFAGLTQFGNLRGSAQAIDYDGLSAGELVDLSVGQDGTVTALYSNGHQRNLFRIPVAEFQNPAGLEAVGASLFRATTNSGQFDGVGRDGIMRGGVLEMSNVDLSEEFTGMIVTQRGFQANSRIISTSDDILQELVNLRR